MLISSAWLHIRNLLLEAQCESGSVSEIFSPTHRFLHTHRLLGTRHQRCTVCWHRARRSMSNRRWSSLLDSVWVDEAVGVPERPWNKRSCIIYWREFANLFFKAWCVLKSYQQLSQQTERLRIRLTKRKQSARDSHSKQPLLLLFSSEIQNTLK